MTELDKLYDIDAVEVAKLSDQDLRLFAQSMFLLESAVSGELERRGFHDHTIYHRLLVDGDASLDRKLSPAAAQALRMEETITEVLQKLDKASR